MSDVLVNAAILVVLSLASAFGANFGSPSPDVIREAVREEVKPIREEQERQSKRLEAVELATGITPETVDAKP